MAMAHDYIQHDAGEGYVALVVYAQPTFEELTRRFPAHVNPDYCNKKFEPIGRCKDVLQEASGLPAGKSVAFELMCMRQILPTKAILVEMDFEGVRPTLYEELLGFDRAYPDAQMKYPIVALGSVSLVRCNLSVACLWKHEDARGLRQVPFNHLWSEDCRFLVVRV